MPIYLVGSIGVALIGLMIVMTMIIATGSFRVRKTKLVIQTGSAEREYNGVPLKNNQWYLAEGDLAEGHHMEVEVRGEQTDIGTGENIAYVRVLDDSDIDVSDQYEIKVDAGKLKVMKPKIVIKGYSSAKVYDGFPLENKEIDYNHSRIGTGNTVVATGFPSKKEPGVYENRFQVNIYNSENQDITDNYDIEYEYGTLTIRYDVIRIRTGSASKEYDGKPLVSSDYYLEYGKVRSGHRLECKTVGTITLVGSASNNVAVHIFGEQGEELTEMYEIQIEPGLLTIQPRRIAIRTLDVNRPVGSDPVTEDWELLDGSLAEGEKLSVRTTQQLANSATPQVGDNRAELISIVAEGRSEDVSTCYQIAYYYGYYEITGD